MFPAEVTPRISRRRNGSRSSRASSTWAGTPCAIRSSPTRNAWGLFPPMPNSRPGPMTCRNGKRFRPTRRNSLPGRRRWSWAFDTPFKWTKQIASHFGGTRQGLAISWPARIKDAGGIRGQFHHIVDIVPTILEVTGIRAPELVDGIQQKPVEGVSMVYTFDKANANAPTTHTTQYFEMISNRGIYHEGWYANTTPPHGPWLLNRPLPEPENYKWELYNLTGDYSQYNDLAAQMPDKLKEMQARFDQEAWKYQVYPLQNSTFARALAPRPSATAGQTVFTYSGEIAGIPVDDAPNILGKSFTITADVDIPQGGGEGVIV